MQVIYYLSLTLQNITHFTKKLNTKMFTIHRKEIGELLALFRSVENMTLPLADTNGKETEESIEIQAVLREEEKVVRCYRREEDQILIERDDSDKVIALQLEEWQKTAEALFESLRQNDDENLVVIDDATEAFLDQAEIFCIAGTAEGPCHLTYLTPGGPLAASVWLRAGAYPTKILDGGRAANLKLEQTGTRFATPMAAKVNGLETGNTLRDRMLLIEDMGSSLKYSHVADKVFRANLSLIDLHLGRLLTEMVRLSYLEDIFRIDELTARMNEENPLKVKSELIEKHGYYEYKIKQLLLACMAGMRPAKIYRGNENLPPLLMIVNPNGHLVAFPATDRMRLADFLYHTTRLERGSMEKDKYGMLERENNVYYFKLNLKIGWLKR